MVTEELAAKKVLDMINTITGWFLFLCVAGFAIAYC
jgi:hypothetical protein